MYGVPASGVSMGPGMMYDVLCSVSSGRSEVTGSHQSVLGTRHDIRVIHVQAQLQPELQQLGLDIIHVVSMFDVGRSMFDFLVLGTYSTSEMFP